jgi:hypothetical protein
LHAGRRHPGAKRALPAAEISAALDWAEQNQLIGAGEADEVSYLWLVRPKTEDEEEG